MCGLPEFSVRSGLRIEVVDLVETSHHYMLQEAQDTLKLTEVASPAPSYYSSLISTCF